MNSSLLFYVYIIISFHSPDITITIWKNIYISIELIDIIGQVLLNKAGTVWFFYLFTLYHKDDLGKNSSNAVPTVKVIKQINDMKTWSY